MMGPAQAGHVTGKPQHSSMALCRLPIAEGLTALPESTLRRLNRRLSSHAPRPSNLPRFWIRAHRHGGAATTAIDAELWELHFGWVLHACLGLLTPSLRRMCVGSAMGVWVWACVGTVSVV